MWSHSARQASIASRKARKGAGHVAGMQSLVQKSGMSSDAQRKLRGHLKVMKKASKHG